MNANRRLQERKPPERIVLCKLGGEKSGSVLNLSEDGLCFVGRPELRDRGHRPVSVDGLGKTHGRPALLGVERAGTRADPRLAERDLYRIQWRKLARVSAAA